MEADAGTTSLNCGPGQTVCGGDQCVDTDTDRANCGACGTACDDGEICNGSGVCELTCQSGLIDCNGTCVDPDTDRAFCGATGDCVANAGTACADGEICNGSGVCELSCQPGLIDCNGTCVDPNDDRDFCGATGDCQAANAGIACTDGEICNGSGTCVPTCAPGQISCGGACVDPDTDRGFCGATGDCQAANAGIVCADGEICNGSGVCELTCQSGLIDCNGTCVDPDTDRGFCGATLDCQAANAGVACADGEICNGSGVCELTCQSGLLDCNGTCVDPDTDRTFCGATTDCTGANDGNVCPAGQICNGAGVCQLTCQAGLLNCGGTCVNPNTDRNFCGATTTCTGATDGNVCAAGQICNGAGVCQVTCQAGLLNCGGTCVDPNSNPSFCGATTTCTGATDGNVCAADQACVSGGCRQLSPLATFVGPQNNVPIASLSGWTACFTQTYNQGSPSIAAIQAACPKANLMMACRPTGSATLQLLAHAPRTDVFFATTGNNLHTANGTGWYFNGSAMGFAPQGLPVSLTSCDTVDGTSIVTAGTGGTQRLCWHTSGGNMNGGWRCGKNDSLNSSTTFERMIFQAD